MNWWLFSCIASALFAVILLFVLGAFRLADEADRRAQLADDERILRHGDQHPWLKD